RAFFPSVPIENRPGKDDGCKRIPEERLSNMLIPCHRRAQIYKKSENTILRNVGISNECPELFR
ncbi:MAG: hypothetical protein Q8862_13890, partial [Bacteroidota bacterium]|nr:hypothetical protein [Bacteroidota bacterium]